MENEDDAKDESELFKEKKEQGRKAAKNYVKGTGLKHMINTSIADNIYSNNAINLYAKRNITATDNLYKGLIRSDADQQALVELLKQIGYTRRQR